VTSYHVVGRRPLVLRVQAVTLFELFEDAAYAVFDQAWRLSDVPATYSRPIIAAGDTLAELLTAWLEELIAMSRAEQLVPSFFVVDRLEEGGVQGSAAGLPVGEAVGRPSAPAELRPSVEGPVAVPEGWWVDIEMSPGGHLRVV
jgi:SHS2 domain-containing protein